MTSPKPAKSVIVKGLLGSRVAAPSGAALGSWIVMVSTGTLEVLSAVIPIVDGDPGSKSCGLGLQDLVTSTPRSTGTSMVIDAVESFGLTFDPVALAVLGMVTSPGGKSSGT